LITVDYIENSNWLLKNNISLIYGIFWIFIAYIIGHILSNLSAWLLEKFVVERLLKTPNVNLFTKSSKKYLLFLFPGYFSPLPEANKKQIIKKARNEGFKKPGEALFFHAFSKVKDDTNVRERLNTFLNLYGFCRNISFAFLLISLFILIEMAIGNTHANIYLIILSLVGAVGMFYRYLKFYRHYALEVYLSYMSFEKNGEKNGN